ncbi:MipA/OmpV family protein [Sulfurimonas sp.]|uniref:MipA/OmpV family protein n=1 Tax=Sulfurimonas sp. TaxID=2022749 RepID=UPI003569D219
MKYFLILLLILSVANAQEKKQKITIGAGPYIQTQPYNNVDDILLPSPVIFFDNGVAYARWTRIGIYFYGDKQEDYSWGFSLTAQPRIYGYKSSDIQGMDERKTSWEGGLAFSAKTDKAYIEIMALTDMLDRHESWILKTEVGYDFEFANFSLYPSLIFIYQSSDFINYYYGVKKSEELGTRKEYIPNEGFQVGAQTYIKYPFTKKLSALVNLRVDKISKEATNSPIVNDDYIYSGLLSLIYTFQY